MTICFSVGLSSLKQICEERISSRSGWRNRYDVFCARSARESIIELRRQIQVKGRVIYRQVIFFQPTEAQAARRYSDATKHD